MLATFAYQLIMNHTSTFFVPETQAAGSTGEVVLAPIA